MFLGVNCGSTTGEMTYEDFLETYGRPVANGSNSPNSDSRSTSSSCDKHSEISGSESVSNKANCDETNFNLSTFAATIKGKSDTMSVSSHPPSAFEVRRRNSKLQHMASRLARKSFRSSKKKGTAESPGPQSHSPTSGGKWNSFIFKRSKSTTRSRDADRSSVSSGQMSEEDGKQQAQTQEQPALVTSLRHPFVRSISHTQVVTSSSATSAATKRNSNESDNVALKKRLEEKLDASKPFATVGCRKEQNRPTFLPISKASSTSLQPLAQEHDVIKKYDDLREEEETRLVAIATLLKRRRNSLKIKCDQFDRELSQKNVTEDRARVIKSRIRHMKRKLEVVNQCIEEQAEEMKATTAKVDLILSLELYKLNLMQEEKDGFKPSTKCSAKKQLLNSPLSTSDSCETLLSMDDTCVFDDASSVTSSKKGDSNNSSPTRQSMRYSVFGANPNSNSQSHGITFPADELMKEKMNTIRSRSIDNTVTSDCDSGFDNGDGLSRSDISLDRSFSKSTGSIASTSSRANHPRSVSCQGSSSSPGITGRQSFFTEKPHSTSESHLYGRRKRNPVKSSSSSCTLEDPVAVDPSVLATIEDFEKFAEKTRRRLSLNGKLVPLKKGL